MATNEEKETTISSMIGYEVIVLFKLKLRDGRVDTAWGTKTPTGLGACIRRIVTEATHEVKENC